jgi:hypothetical protein
MLPTFPGLTGVDQWRLSLASTTSAQVMLGRVGSGAVAADSKVICLQQGHAGRQNSQQPSVSGGLQQMPASLRFPRRRFKGKAY